MANMSDPRSTGTARVIDKTCPLSPGALMLIEHMDRHEIKNTGEELLRTLNFYVPPGFTRSGDELPAGRP